jgi:hypothetical protein
MALEDDGNIGEDVAALFDSSVAPTNLDAADNGVGGAGGQGQGCQSSLIAPMHAR